MPLFNRIVIVDWSAASSPTTGKDSIWIAVNDGSRTEIENVPTRLQAVQRLREIIVLSLDANERVLVGFDFPFGYPAGIAGKITGKDSALALWRWMSSALIEGNNNRNNRFDVASQMSRRFDGTGPFWGRPAQWDFPEIPTTEKARTSRSVPERRLADERAKGAKTVWQLAYAGSVGSQVICGLPAVQTLRDDLSIASFAGIWPFETGLKPPTQAVTFAEVYPSLFPPDPGESIRDAGQVRAVADHFAMLDRGDALARLFMGPDDLTEAERQRIETEEAWILGLGAEQATAPSARPLSYERNPADIYRQSFATVRREAALDHMPDNLQPIAIRLVHACGMPEITARLIWSDDLVQNAKAAMKAGAPVLCDCEAVASMIVRDRLPSQNPVLCTLNDPGNREVARRIANTRSAAAVEAWRDHVEGAIVAIGNAPTALFHLLELLDQGWPRPAAILGFPVGFVGAAESKAELAARPRGTPFLALRGRRGGSAMAAAAVNALAAGLRAPS